MSQLRQRFDLIAIDTGAWMSNQIQILPFYM